MKTLLSLVLMLGVLSGLLVQETTLAAAPLAVGSPSAAQMRDCAGSMRQGAPDDGQAPCGCAWPGCAMIAGGILALSQPGAPVLAYVPDFISALHDIPAVQFQPGHVTGPEPEPPILLI